MTSVDIEVEGLAALTKQLGAISGRADDVLSNVITELVVETHSEAVRGIQGGPNTGRVYEKYAPRRKHRASSAGQYPASDTGRLAASIGQQLPTDATLIGKVGTDVIYGRYLEFGTSGMAARPWLLPSFEKAKVGVSKELKREIERLLKNA